MSGNRRHYDVIVVGLGTAGAATCMELARRGVSVAGFDAGTPPHTSGSHHGRSRSIRRAYMEGSAYVPMVMRAWELWRRLETDSGTELLLTTANLTVGPESGSAVRGVQASAKRYGIPHEMLSAADIRRRWPVLRPRPAYAGAFEVEAGILRPEAAITAMLAAAEAAGARLHTRTPVTAWEEEGDHVVLQTAAGRYEAAGVVLATGARVTALAQSLSRAVQPRRIPVCWFAPERNDQFALGSLPVSFWQVPVEAAAGSPYWEVYSLPIVEAGGGVKVAAHNRLAACDPDNDPPQVRAAEIASIRGFLSEFIPALADTPVTAERCFYATTPDGEFVLGPVPGSTRAVTGVFSGHGFKFAPVLGEILADLATGIGPRFDLRLFSPDRLRPQSRSGETPR